MITTFGYFLNLVVVPGLAFVGNWQATALLVVAERTGKSLRGPARDILLSDATEIWNDQMKCVDNLRVRVRDQIPVEYTMLCFASHHYQK